MKLHKDDQIFSTTYIIWLYPLIKPFVSTFYFHLNYNLRIIENNLEKKGDKIIIQQLARTSLTF